MKRKQGAKGRVNHGVALVVVMMMIVLLQPSPYSTRPRRLVFRLNRKEKRAGLEKPKAKGTELLCIRLLREGKVE